jgi:hypothetical protein
VNFYSASGSTFIGTATLSGGVATFTTSSLSVATHHIVAKYLGSATDAASESAVLNQVANSSPTTTKLTSTPNPSTPGQTVTFTATVAASTGPAPTGTVSFSSANGLIGTGTLSGGVATFTITSLSAATHHIVAKYLGSGTDATSESAVLLQVVN